jgi:hypothetical protein
MSQTSQVTASSYQWIHKYGLAIVLFVFSSLGLLYDFYVPLFEKPDELKHFAVIHFIQSHGQLPLVEAGVYQPWDQEGTQPPLYHLLAALLTSWLDLTEFEEPPRNPHYVDERSFVWRERGNNNLYLHAPDEARNTTPVFLAARLARWLSLLAGAGTITLTYFLGRVIFGAQMACDGLPNPPGANNALPLLAAALVTFIPQFLHVSSAITNDGLSATIAVATLLVLALIVKWGISTRYAVYLGGILGIGALTKLSLLYLWPLAGLVLLLDFYRRRLQTALKGLPNPGLSPDLTIWVKPRLALVSLIKFSLMIGGLALLIAGWWYWRNWQLYSDPTALNAHLLYRGGPLNPRPSLAHIWQTELTGLELSFWAAFGAGQILLEPWLYEILSWLKYLVLLGIIIGFWRTIRPWISTLKPQMHDLKKQKANGPKTASNTSPPFTIHHSPFAIRHSPFIIHHSSFVILTLLVLWSLILFIALLRWMQITPASWGRLLYPALPALAILAVWGLFHLRFTIYPQNVEPSNFYFPWTAQGRLISNLQFCRAMFYALRFTLDALPHFLLLFLLTLSLLSPFLYLRAAYAKTPLVTEAELPPEGIKRLDFFYGDEALRLIGYRLEPASVRPGEWLPVTLYWQATQPISKNYSVFVHLLDTAGNSIGQANTYPAGGNWPASFLEPGGVLEDTYYLPVPPETEAPQLTRLAIGIFEFEDPARTAKIALNSVGQVVEPIVEGLPLIPQQWPALKPAQPFEANFGGQIKLIGYDPIHPKIRPGTRVPITFYWETLSPPGQNLTLFIHVIDPAAQTQVAGFDAPPRYPTAFWQPGNTIVDARTLAIPPDLPAGHYELRIGWYNLNNFARLPLLDKNDRDDALFLFSVSVE